MPRIECMHMHLHIPRTCMHCMHHLFRGLLFVPQGIPAFRFPRLHLSSKDLPGIVHYVPCIYLSSLERHPHGSRRAVAALIAQQTRVARRNNHPGVPTPCCRPWWLGNPL